MEGTSVRRRLVQSTLFPHVDRSVKGVENCDGKREDEADEEAERCGSSNKKKEGKKKASVKKKSPAASSKKVTENGQETLDKQVGESDSPAVRKSNFFVKASEKQQQKRQQSQPILIDSPGENDDIFSTPSSVANGGSTPRKMKWRNNSTPKKERTPTPKKERTSTPNKKMKSGARELCFGAIPFDLTVDEQSLETIPDLRLEAKRTAEENSRMYSGRQIHPFFTTIKGGKTNQDLTYQENQPSSSEKKEKGIVFNPIHVLENAEVDHMTLNWGDWIFSEISAMDGLECGCSPVNEKSVDTLNFDKFFSVSHFTIRSLYQNYDQCSTPRKEVSHMQPSQSDCSHRISSSSFADKTVMWNEQQELDVLSSNMHATSVELMLLDDKPESLDFFVGSSCGGNLESELQEKILHERITSHYHTSHSTPENCLWTDKYHPQNAKQICGNGESVKFLSEWLHLWYQRGSLTSRSCSKDGILARDIDTDYQPNDSDSDTIDGEDSLKNVLLVTGPVGCGKSAAIYACARDQGFQVIEINASDWRNGALIKQKFGEAVESHCHQRTVENATKPDKKDMPKYFSVVKAETHCFDNEVIELIDLADKEDSQDATTCQNMSVSEDIRTNNYQNEIKNLILFEDVDINLCEDHGFVTTIQQLAETAKRPMILTSNSDYPVLPKNMARSELNFSLPLREELLELVYKICAAEKTKVEPGLVERFTDYCQGDIRKTIMLLQFWFHGPTLGTDYEMQLTYSPVVFDLVAGHHILPKLIPWGYPSKLSEHVEKEVVESLHLVEANGCRAENMHIQDGLLDPFEAKKEAMLNLHRSFQDELEDAEFHDHYQSPGSPVTFARNNSRRKMHAVLSSDSEDEFIGCSAVVSDGMFDINVEVVDMEIIPSSHCLSAGVSHHPTEEIYNSQIEKLEEDCSRVNDMSFVPESSFVPETEILNESDLHSTSVSYGHFVEEESKCIIRNQDLLPNSELAASTQFNEFLHVLHDEQEPLGNISDANITRAYQEEIGDSISKSEADVPLPNGHRLLDECSRVDFRRLKKSLDNSEAEKVIDYVQETWKRLHDPCKDLRKYITEEEKTAFQALKFAHGICNLFSEADLLLKDCQSQVSDSFRSSLIPSEKMHSHSYYDDQLEMSSVLAQHGMCLFAKEISSLDPIMGSRSRMDLASEMLSNSSCSIALGKLASLDPAKFDTLHTKTPKNSNLLTSNSDFDLSNILQSVVPSKSYLTAKGYAFHEYISTLSQISRFENSRISECLKKKNLRRGRVARHYLTSGSLAMSSEDISMLGQYSSYQKVTSLGDESCR